MRPKDTLDIREPPPDFAVMTTSDTVRPVAAESTTDSLEMTTDVVIVGGGLAGLTLAAALASAGVPVICLDRDTPPTQMEQDFDGRTTALAFCSKRVLEGAGVWPHMAEDAEPILDIRVVDQASPLFLHYDHQDVGIGPFGWIADNIVIRRALFARVAELPGLRHIVPAQVTRIDRDVKGARVTLSDGRVVKARLVIGADGKNSFCRKSAGIGVVTWKYDQSAMICNIAHDQPHGGVAVEKFLPGGPFAVLPLTDNRSSIVWSEQKSRVPMYMGLSDAAFTAELQKRVGSWLGPIRVVTKRSAWPLSVLHAERYVAQRLALAGEAAHAMHPIAGQGLNMGLRDVAALAEVIVDAHRLGLDVGGPEPLARYERWRRFDNLTLITVTDLLTRLFSNDFGPLKLARGLGMAAVNRMPPLKKFFMRHAMGMVGELPRMIRGERL